MIGTPKNAEQALRERDAHWAYGRAMPLVAPGSAEEANALDMIDQGRAEEQERLQDTFTTRRRRHERHWRKHI